MINVATILGSTRPNRNGEAVANWVYQLSAPRDDAEFQLIDLKSIDLPLLDEPMPASFGQYAKPHTKKWAETIAPFDAYFFVTPEYNHSVCGALKNAIDFLYKEWNNKAAGFGGYGASVTAGQRKFSAKNTNLSKEYEKYYLHYTSCYRPGVFILICLASRVTLKNRTIWGKPYASEQNKVNATSW